MFSSNLLSANSASYLFPLSRFEGGGVGVGIEESEGGVTNDCSSGLVLALERVFTSEISTGLLWLMSFSRSLSGKGEVPNNNFAASSLGFDATDACISISFESGSAEEPQDTKRTKIARIGRRIIKWGKIAFIGKQLQNCVNRGLQAQFVKEGLCLHNKL